ncbi:MAG: LacI family transcriptional regulator [Crocinitomicaceae bacterium]|nr:LacI family transcriptional regulator [Crocinitomicaceae bacterium]
MKTKRTSLEDIAKAVGVSKATVSFVLNGKGDQFNISKAKQKIIQDTAKEMQYVPNFFAKSLRQGETKTIGLVVSDISNSFYAELCKSIQEQLHANGYNLFIVNTNDDDKLELSLIRELFQRSVDGMIVSPSNKIEKLETILKETKIPIVFADRPVDPSMDFVGVDNFTEAKNLIGKFSKKPNKLAVIFKANSLVVTLEDRIKGARAACDELNIPMELVQLPDSQSKANTVIKELLNNQFDSFLVLNNVVVMKLLASLRNNKSEIGKNARLICFDDDEAFEFVEPPITALRQPIKEIGKQAVDRVLARIKDHLEPGNQNLRTCKLIERKSH